MKVLLAVSMLCGTLFVPVAPALAEAADEAPTAEQIEQWVQELASLRYRDRELATRKLVQAGAAAVGPVTKAAQAANLETSSRALEVLSRLSTSGNLEAEDTALEALEKLAEDRITSTAFRAAGVLKFHSVLRQERALEELQKLGAVVERGAIAGNFSSLATHIVVKSNWKGGNEGLDHLRWVLGLSRLSIYAAPIDDAAIDTLVGLDELERLELYGTDVTEKARDRLQQQRPQLVIDYRDGALLGVACEDHPAGCVIRTVQAGSAAHKHGLEIGDVITKFEGENFTGFAGLTALIAKKKGGEKVTLEIVRGDEMLNKEVVLGRWGE